jgi:hypothetical protein
MGWQPIIRDVLDDLDDVSIASPAEGDMIYRNDSGLWVVVAGTKGDGKTPTGQPDGSVAWEEPGGGAAGRPWEAATVGAYDDYFDANNESDWTNIAPDTGTATWTYQHNAHVGDFRGVQCVFANQNTSDLSAYVKSLSGITTGDYAQARFSSLMRANVFGGVVFTDGTTTAANYVLAALYQGTGMLGIDGTLTASNAGTFTFSVDPKGDVWLRLLYSAANTFQVFTSHNGVDFAQVGTNIAHTMTPTHGGFAVASQGVTVSQLIKFSDFHSNVTP